VPGRADVCNETGPTDKICEKEVTSDVGGTARKLSLRRVENGSQLAVNAGDWRLWNPTVGTLKQLLMGAIRA